MSSTPVKRATRASLLRDRPEPSPGKSPDAKRPTVEEKRAESHGLTTKARSAKAHEGAANTSTENSDQSVASCSSGRARWVRE